MIVISVSKEDLSSKESKLTTYDRKRFSCFGFVIIDVVR